MADLIVRPSYQLTERDILTVEKINLMATPVVELALQDPVNDQNFFRNGNFYSSFWTTPAGVNCPAGSWITNANYWLCRPSGGDVTFLRSATVPDQFSLFSAQIKGNANVGDVEFGQQINGDLSATLRRKCTFSGYIYNGTGLTVSPKLNFYTADAFNNFSAITLQATVNLQTAPNAGWTYVTATLDCSTLANIANGLSPAILIPAGALNDPAKYILFSRIKIQIGEVATEFVDDTSLFVQAPSVDSTMLQDGCIARPGLFLPNVVPSGAYQAKSINKADLNDDSVDDRVLATGAAVANLGYTPVNKAGDTAVGKITHDVDTVVHSTSFSEAAVISEVSSANASNDGYFPAIAFNRPGVVGRAVGLAVDGRLKTVDQAGAVGYLLDSVTKVDTASYQDKSVTFAKLADSLVNLLIPPGITSMFSGPTPPTGWLICDGRAVSRTTYAALFAAIGTYWGAGDNITTFNLPDLRGRAPIGYVNSAAPGITARTFGARGGEEAHVSTVAELPSHTHVVNDPWHAHGFVEGSHFHQTNFARAAVSPGSPLQCLTGAGGAIGVPTEANSITVASSVSAGPSNISLIATGSGAAHNNMQPFSVLYFIIKT